MENASNEGVAKVNSGAGSPVKTDPSPAPATPASATMRDLSEMGMMLRSEFSVAIVALRSEFASFQGEVVKAVAETEKAVADFRAFLASGEAQHFVHTIETRLSPLENAVSAMIEKFFPHVFQYRAPATEPGKTAEASAAEASKSA